MDVRNLDVLCFLWTVIVIAFCVLNFSIGLELTSLPNFFHELITHGKQRRTLKSKWAWLSVQKRWFTIFYLWGLLWNLVILCYYVCHVKGVRMTFLHTFFQILFYPNNLEFFHSTSELSLAHIPVTLSLLLVIIQTSRRLTECVFVTNFNPNSRMHLAHVIFGMFFYTVIGPGILKQLDKGTAPIDSPSIPLTSVFQMKLAILLFYWSSWHQYKCHRILADIRRHGSKTMTSSRYTIPHGDWFKYCSSPHYCAEILIYLSIWLLVGLSNAYCFLCFLATVLNLVYTARLNHNWLVKTFEDYPKERRIIMPLIY